MGQWQHIVQIDKQLLSPSLSSRSARSAGEEREPESQVHHDFEVAMLRRYWTDKSIIDGNQPITIFFQSVT
jgi:hypothetical protein